MKLVGLIIWNKIGKRKKLNFKNYLLMHGASHLTKAEVNSVTSVAYFVGGG